MQNQQQNEKSYLWVTGSFNAAARVKDAEGDSIKIIESRPFGDDKVTLFVAVNRNTADEFVREVALLGMEASNINPARTKTTGIKPERKSRRKAIAPTHAEAPTNAAAQPSEKHEDKFFEADPRLTALNFAWHHIAYTMPGAMSGECKCSGCTAIKTLMGFVEPFVRHMENGIAVPLTGNPDVDQAMMRTTLVNHSIVERGCCPNIACRCERLVPIEQLHPQANVRGLMTCRQCGFSVNVPAKPL